MARTMPLAPAPSHRAVILMRFSGIHGAPMETYPLADGSTIDYHAALVFGPYGTQSMARSRMTREVTLLKLRGTWFGHQPQYSEFSYQVPSEVDAFTECTSPVWIQT